MIIFFEVKDPGEAAGIRARADTRYLGITPEGKEQWQCTDGKVKYFLLPLSAARGAKENSEFRIPDCKGRWKKYAEDQAADPK